jgi:hypothetical protein
VVTLLDDAGRIAERVEGLARPVTPFVEALERLARGGATAPADSAR